VRFKNENFITDATVDTFATCGFNFPMPKYAQCGPRLRVLWLDGQGTSTEDVNTDRGLPLSKQNP